MIQSGDLISQASVTLCRISCSPLRPYKLSRILLCLFYPSEWFGNCKWAGLKRRVFLSSLVWEFCKFSAAIRKEAYVSDLTIFRACISAICRLVRTVDFARDSDSMYIIGSLLFWATAEMTCGFLIFSVPCLSKIVLDSGLRRRITRKDRPNLSPRDLPNPSPKSTPPYRSQPISRRSLSRTWLATETRYSQMEEDGIPLNDQGKSESQINLSSLGQGDKLQIQVDVRNLDEPRLHTGAESSAWNCIVSVHYIIVLCTSYYYISLFHWRL